MNRFKIFLVMVVSMFVFGVSSFATVYVNTKELEKDGVVITPNQTTREDTTVVHFADVDWYVIGTDGESKMTLLMLDAMTPEQGGDINGYVNAVNYAAGTGNTTVLNQTVATRKLINQSGNVEYDLAEPQEEISGKRLYLLSKSEAENVSNDIRRNILNWWTRDKYYSYPEGFSQQISTWLNIPVRPSVTLDISNIDLSTGFYNGDTSKKVLYMVNRGDIASNKATNVNTLPVTVGDITITPNQGTNQIVKLGDYSFYPIGSNGENKVTLLARNNMVSNAWNSTTLYGKWYAYNNQYYTSAMRTLLNSWIYGAPEGYTASKNLSTFGEAIDTVLLNEVATGDSRYINGMDSYYQSDKLFLLSRYEMADVNLDIRKSNNWSYMRSPHRGSTTNAYYIKDNGFYAFAGANGGTVISAGVRPALVLNLDKVNLTTTTSNGVETITATMK